MPANFTSLLLEAAGVAEPEKAVQDSVPLGLAGQIRAQIEYEANLAKTEPATKSKLILALISMLGFGSCGIDRCFMGSMCLGIIKGLTGGGFVIWALIDYVVILINCLTKDPNIDAVGFHGVFEDSSVNQAFLFTAIFLAVKVVFGILGKVKSSSGRTKVAEEISEQSKDSYVKLLA